MDKLKDITHKAKDQAKDALNEVKHGGVQGEPPSAQHRDGPHKTDAANVADPRIDSDRDGSRNAGMASGNNNTTSTGYGNTTSTTGGYGNTTSTTGGYGDDLDSRHRNTEGHDSKLANKMDPRIDSDRDGSRNAGMASGNNNNNTTPTGYGNTTSTGGGYGNITSTTGGGYGDDLNSRNRNTEGHDSKFANKMDPRIDSDRDGSRNAGMAGGINTASAGYGNTTSTTDGYGDDLDSRNRNTEVHGSKFANKMDPRVDSDGDGSRNAGMKKTGVYDDTTSSNYTTNTTGGYGDTSRNTNTGSHDSNLRNNMDPRIDSDRDGSRNAGLKQDSTGYGNTSDSYGDNSLSNTGKTTGPHNSDTMNRMDPRVDSRVGEL